MTQLELDLAPKRVYYKRDKPLKVLELLLKSEVINEKDT